MDRTLSLYSGLELITENRPNPLGLAEYVPMLKKRLYLKGKCSETSLSSSPPYPSYEKKTGSTLLILSAKDNSIKLKTRPLALKSPMTPIFFLNPHHSYQGGVDQSSGTPGAPIRPPKPPYIPPKRPNFPYPLTM